MGVGLNRPRAGIKFEGAGSSADHERRTGGLAGAEAVRVTARAECNAARLNCAVVCILAVSARVKLPAGTARFIC